LDFLEIKNVGLAIKAFLALEKVVEERKSIR
jgi:hypothetical protein